MLFFLSSPLYDKQRPLIMTSKIKNFCDFPQAGKWVSNSASVRMQCSGLPDTSLPPYIVLFSLHTENTLKNKKELLKTTCVYVMTKSGLFRIALKLLTDR